jgi:hypothetical protein
MQGYVASKTTYREPIDKDLVNTVFAVVVDIRRSNFEPAPARSGFSFENVGNVGGRWLRHGRSQELYRRGAGSEVGDGTVAEQSC